MAWIELHENLPTHKKTRRFARLLGLSVPQEIPQAVGYLCVFWLWSMGNATNGTLNGFDAQDVADAAGWTGEPEAFLSAMQESGFIDVDEDGLKIHDWMDYAGRYLEYKEKAERAKQKNRERQRRFQEKAKGTPKGVPAELADENWLMIAKAYEKNIGMLPMGTALDDLVFYADELRAEIVCKAIEVTNKAMPNNPHRYLMSILKKWLENKVNTLEKVEAYTKDLERRIKAKRGVPAQAEGGPPAIEGEFY